MDLIEVYAKVNWITFKPCTMKRNCPASFHRLRACLRIGEARREGDRLRGRQGALLHAARALPEEGDPDEQRPTLDLPGRDRQRPAELPDQAGPRARRAGVAAPAPAPASAVVADTPKNLVIQLGAFSDSVKAKQQLDGLIANGFNAYTESLKTANGEVTRVRIGPYTNRNTAESELKKLKKLGFEGVLTSS